MVDWTGYAPSSIMQYQALVNSGEAVPPPEVMNAIGGFYDTQRLRWDPDQMALVDRTTGQVAYDYRAATADPWANGSELVTDLTAYNQSRGTEGAIHLDPGEIPYFGFGDSAQDYNAGLMPGSGIFASTNPNEISDYQDHRQDYVNRGVASVGALVGGTALAGQLLSGASTGIAAGTPTQGLSGMIPGVGSAVEAAGGMGALGGFGAGLAPISLEGTLAGAGQIAAPAGLPASAGLASSAASTAAGLSMGPGTAGAIGAGTAALPTLTNTATTVASNTNTGQIPNPLDQQNQGPPAPTGGGGNILSTLGDYLPEILSGLGAIYNNQQTREASDNAVAAYQQATQQGLDFARESRDMVLAQQEPFRQAAVQATGALTDMTGLTNNGYQWQQDPGYQFRLNESMRALENSAAAKGGLLSGNFANTALQRAGDYASQEYTNVYNRIANIAGMNQVSGPISASAAGNYGNNALGAAQSAGAVNASGYMARSNATAQMLNQITEAIGGIDWGSIFHR